SLRAHPQPTSIPEHQLQPIALSVAEQKHMSAQRLALQAVPHQTKQSVESLAHVRGTYRQINPGRRSQSKHGLHSIQYTQQTFQRHRIKPFENFHSLPLTPRGRTTVNRPFDDLPAISTATSLPLIATSLPTCALPAPSRLPANVLRSCRRLFRQTSSVPTATPCCWQNSRRRNPLDSNASNRCSASARLRRC